MSRITINDFKTTFGVTQTYDIMNSIRNEASESFKQYVPLANADNVAEVGAGLLTSQTLQNEFVNALVDRFAAVIIEIKSFRNILAPFKQGRIEYGRIVEEVYTDIAKSHTFDPEEAENTLFKRTPPNVKSLFHERNREEFYPATIQDSQLKKAFVSWNEFDRFLTSIISSLYNSAQVDEYKYMKLIMDNYYSKGLFKVEKIDDTTTTAGLSQLVKKMRELTTLVTLPTGSREFNAMGVHTMTDMQDLHLIIDAKLNASLDVDVLAKAFNIDRTSLLGQITVIDNFASPGLRAVMVDRSFFKVWDHLYQMESTRNAKGLYWNYFLHVQQTHSASRFANAIAFVEGEVPPVTQVIVSPSIVNLKQGRTQEFTSIVRVTDGNEYDVVWSVEAGRNDELTADTKIDQKGVLTVGKTQTGTIVVKATATYSTGEETTKDVVGEAYVTIQTNNSLN